MTDEESDTLYGLSFLLIHRYHANPQNSTSSFRGTPWRSPFSAGEGLCCASVCRYSVLERNYLLSSLREWAVAIRRLGEFCVHSIGTDSLRHVIIQFFRSKISKNPLTSKKIGAIIHYIKCEEQKPVGWKSPAESCRSVRGNGNILLEFILLAVR